MLPQIIISTSNHDIWVGSAYLICGFDKSHCYANGSTVVFEHYDGHGWAVSYSPDSGGYEYLDSMAEPNSNTVYAVGTHEASSSGYSFHPDILKWSNGVWTRLSVPLPNDYHDSDKSDFHSIVAISSRDIWMGGQYSDLSGKPHALLEHYDGHTWSIIQAPASFTQIISLQRQANTSNVLALGSDGTASQVLSLNVTKAHGNQVGIIAPIPQDPFSQNNPIIDMKITVFSSNHDIWARNTYFICIYREGHCYASRTGTVFEHYDGYAWTASNPPDPSYLPDPGSYEEINGMAEPNSNTVYAVGTHETSSSSYSFHPDILKWSNGVWTRLSVPLPSDYHDSGYNGEFRSIVAISSRNIWIGGQYSDLSGKSHALLEHYDGRTWSSVQAPANFTQIISLQRQEDTSTILALGSDGTTAQVLSLRA